MADLEHIAARAGLSLADASRALRGLPSVPLAQRLLVQQIALDAEARLLPSSLADLATRAKVHSVGLVVPDLRGWYWGEVAAGAEAACADARCDLVIHAVPVGSRRTQFFAELPFVGRSDGLVLVDVPLDDGQRRSLHETGVPVSCIGSAPGLTPRILLDDAGGARAAAEHLLGLGHRRIGVIAGDIEQPEAFTVPADRLRAIRATLTELGDGLPDTHVDHGGFSIAGGMAAATRLLDLHPRPTALLAISDDMAIGALGAAQAFGLRVPDDLAIMGFDDRDVAEPLGLSTMQQRPDDLAFEAVRRLLEEASGRLLNRTVRVSPTLMARRSTVPGLLPSGR